MKIDKHGKKAGGFLSRLRGNESGNTLAMFGAAIFPLAGLIGGGLDMSRIYLTRVRLQAACDSGALAGRKQMGIGTWAADSGKANTEAVRMFSLNFAPNSYGTTSTAPAFVETSGNVTGTATATIPMTIMRIFGTPNSSIAVSCNAAMSIPNTDIMFVLDTTGSMAFQPNGGTANAANPSKMVGLRKVVKCFYESLAKIDITTVQPADCNEPSNPSGGNVSGSQIRFGFVPYSSNVNVGKLLSNDNMADSFTYQSREAVLTPVWVYALGAESAVSYGTYNNPAEPSAPASWTNYVENDTNSNQNINGTDYSTIKVLSNANCLTTTPVPANTTQIGAEYDTPGSTNSAAPVHPENPIAYGNYTRTKPRVKLFYRYNRNTGTSGNNRCRLQYGSASYDQTKAGTSNKTVTWTQYTDTFTEWDYKPRSLTVSGFKAGGRAWNSTTSLPVGFSTENLLVSGTTGVSYKRVANMNAEWDGCIEERQTFRTNSWSPYPTNSPDLDMITPPTADDNTKWKPSLKSGTWARFIGTTISEAQVKYSNTRTSTDLADNVDYYCPSPARLLAEYNTATAAADFGQYLDDLVAVGATYHDIGMLWGGRMIAPNGVFSANNQVGTLNGIDRNIIFMTDGDTDSSYDNNTAYGMAPWDRRQEVDNTVAPSEAGIDTKINARFEAICDQLTNNDNITVWVVSFGGTGINATTKSRLKRCSTNGDTEPDGVHYFDATNTAALLTSFKAIASAISQLRLTN